MISQSPAYNLKVVLNETGLKADVLRAWERRYCLPAPSRTPGGHRLYSEYDIEMLKWLKRRQEEGLSISRAVDLWRETIAAGHDPLVTTTPSLAGISSQTVPADATRIDLLRQDWLEANLAFDSLKADEALNQAFAFYPVETVCSEIIQRGIGEIGDHWFFDRASVQQEHFASALATRRLETLLAATPRPTRHLTVLVGCPPGEHHTLPVLMLTLYLSRKGFKVIYLGANIPLEKLADTSRSIQPDLIVLGAQTLATAATLLSAALALKDLRIPLAYGGLIFNRVPGLHEHIPAVYLGDTLQEAVQLVERLVLLPASPAISVTLNESMQELARQYRDHRPRIEALLTGELEQSVLKVEYLLEANFFFGNGLTAALELGEPAFMEADLEWVQRLLAGRQIGGESLPRYLAAYRRAIQTEMGDLAAPLTDWFGSYLAEHEGLPL